MTDYKDIVPITSPIKAERQGAKRHYGVHPYFTRRPYNVVKEYILHYSQENDIVMDPFGGSGVTAIEAFLENRTGVQNDINPLANFIAKGIFGLQRGKVVEYTNALAELQKKCQKKIDDIEINSKDNLSEYGSDIISHLPPNIPLPHNSDVKTYHELFLPRQIAALIILKQAVDEIDASYVRNGLLLAWSATLTKLNRTFLSAKGRLASRGGSSLFSIYRYKIAKDPVLLSAWSIFHERALNIIAAKKEIDQAIELKIRTTTWSGRFVVAEKDIKDICEEYRGKVDYIYTDPPYGGHISYLDLSTLWNGWLGMLPGNEAKEKELIVGGDIRHSQDEYVERLGEAIKYCRIMLKPDRWISIVFQHWDTKYFEAILTAAEETGMELKAAISQVGDPIWSMHKKKGNKTVLAGEMILTFLANGKKHRQRRERKFSVEEGIAQILRKEKRTEVYGEYLFKIGRAHV